MLNGAVVGTRMSAATRERVEQAAAELAYRPNANARSLRQQSVMHSIGFYDVFGGVDLSNPFLAAIIGGTHSGCDKHECDLMFHRHPHENTLDSQVREIINGKVDGVIVYAQWQDDTIDRLVANKFPTVSIADFNPKVPSVTADDEGGGVMIARHLARRGHQRAIFRLPPFPRDAALRRYNGFAAAARELGIEVTRTFSPDYVGTLSDDELTLLTGETSKRPTAVACWNDGSALEVYKYYVNVDASDRPAIIGYDGFQNPYLPVNLSAVHVPWKLVATTAVDVLIDIIAGDPVDRHTKVPVQFIEGDTG